MICKSEKFPLMRGNNPTSCLYCIQGETDRYCCAGVPYLSAISWGFIWNLEGGISSLSQPACTDSVRQGKPCRSRHESPFHSDLQLSCSRASSWEHLTLAHLPVHPPTPPTRTQRSYPRNTERELKNLTTLFLTNLSHRGKDVFFPRKSPASSSWQFRSLQQIQSGL
ncbi:hypothetical protein AMECASPLE_025979 [Ameca splendens]|uniref:Uncharacterized protein n=1 Tax=Ameca splendens TaxID=208324 RepID=A0ABV1ACR4_9TELE